MHIHIVAKMASEKKQKRYAECLSLFKRMGLFQEGPKTYLNYISLILWSILASSPLWAYLIWVVGDIQKSGFATLKIFIAFSTSSPYLTGTYVYLTFWYHSENFFCYFKKLETLELPCKAKLLKIYDAFSNFLAVSGMCCFVIAIIILVGLTKCDDYVENCGLLLNATVFVDIDYTPARQITCVLQCVMVLMSLYPGITMISTMILIFQSLIHMYEDVANMLRGIKWLTTRSDRKKQIKKSVQFHLEVLQLDKYQHSFTKYVMMTLAVQILIISSTIYQYFLNDGFEIVLVIPSICWGLLLLIACQEMEQLKSSSLSVARAAYECMPLQDDFASQQELEIIADMALKPRQCKIMMWVIIDNSYFLLTAKIVYSLFSLLHQLYSKE